METLQILMEKRQNPRMSCKVVLDTTGSLSPGVTLYGRVVCNVTTNQCVREIRCKLVGKEYTTIKSAKDTFEAHNEFLIVKMTLMGEVSLEPRQHEYPFCFTLPKEIPSSLETEFGCIKYCVKATVDIPFSFDYIDEITLPVEVPVNFNDIQDELQLKPVTFNNEKTVCCFCCAGGEISMNLQLEKNAFILGEIAKVQIELKNMSRVNIDQIMLTLTRIWNYKSEGRKERTKEIIATETDTGTDAHTQRTYQIQFQIPRTISIHNLVKCILMKETFRLRAEVVLPLAHRDLVVDANIKLGHIPLEQSKHKDNLLLPPPSQEPSKH